LERQPANALAHDEAACRRLLAETNALIAAKLAACNEQ
jgi:hypothetical protein